MKCAAYCWDPDKVGTERVVIAITHPTEDGVEEIFDGDWRLGKEIRRIIITLRLYQVSRYETQFWFSKS